MARDNFSKEVIRQLQAGVAFRCSNPTCRVPTVASKTNGESTTSMGVAAHIHAASPGGPRYLVSMSTASRKAIKNGIWLCSNCATIIDRDVEIFPAELLYEWKKTAQEKSVAEYGKKLPEEKDAVNLLANALSGLPTSFKHTAISNVHSATAKSLESLDPRFKINSSFTNGATHYEIVALEDATLAVTLNSNLFHERLDDYSKHIKCGEDFVMKADGITFEGSKLFESIFSELQGATLTLIAPKRKAIYKLWTKSSSESEPFYFDDVIGTLSLGTDEGSFHGSACDNIFELQVKKIKPNEKSAPVTLTINMQKWAGLDVRQLPYSSRIFKLFENIESGSYLYSSVEIDGFSLVSSVGNKFNELEYFQDHHYFFEYTKCAQAISNYLNIPILFNPNTSFTRQEFYSLLDVVKVIQGKYDHQIKNPKNQITFDLVAGNGLENLNLLKDVKEPSVFRMTENEGAKLLIFGQEILMPPSTLIISAVMPRIISRRKKIQVGDTVKCKLVPTEKTSLLRIYENTSI